MKLEVGDIIETKHTTWEVIETSKIKNIFTGSIEQNVNIKLVGANFNTWVFANHFAEEGAKIIRGGKECKQSK